jgi:heparanase 1
MRKATRRTIVLSIMAAIVPAATHPAPPGARTIQPQALQRLAEVDPRFQSYNVEMAEVIGGNFWKPYGPGGTVPKAAPVKSFEIGQAPGMFEPRAPINLANRRLRLLAASLGPAYVRVSGTWANSAYFQDDDKHQLSKPPPGFQGVLTRAQWRGVIDFARAVDARLVTSFAISSGVRDSAGVWTAKQAGPLVDYTRRIGGKITAAELFNEPTMPAAGGAPPGYDASMFARDEAVFRRFVKTVSPQMLIAGPGSVGEGGHALFPASMPMLQSKNLLSASPPPRFDIFSYHFYGAVSRRCETMAPGAGARPENALSEAWLASTDAVFDFYKPLHDRYAPGTPIWITETADSACGGNPWGATFLDSFRYLDQLGRLARRGVAAIFHNTLASSEYGLLDQRDFAPRPNYWAALLWRRLMSPVVLDAGPIRPGLHLYAHCLSGRRGGVVLLAINNSRSEPAMLRIPTAIERYTLSAETLQSRQVKLNGQFLALGRDDRLPRLAGLPVASGSVALAPATITFLALPQAGNAACR